MSSLSSLSLGKSSDHLRRAPPDAPSQLLEKDRGLVESSRGRRAPFEELVIGERSSHGSTRRTQKIGKVELPIDGVALPSSSPCPH
ncbi:hypothetical protein NL676_028708 [Syzygium grande]|nr:hypothetical protein NL676_028708 [Syzygium grande]